MDLTDTAVSKVAQSLRTTLKPQADADPTGVSCLTRPPPSLRDGASLTPAACLTSPELDPAHPPSWIPLALRSAATPGAASSLRSGSDPH